MRIETDLDGKTVGAIERHYFHAREKHPYFCDGLIASQLPNNSLDEDSDRALLNDFLRDIRNNNSNDASRGNVLWSNLLDEEKWEVLCAISEGNKAQAIEECYDSIAVLLRVIDVLEGRQVLGEPGERVDLCR